MDCEYCWRHPLGMCAYHRLAETDDTIKAKRHIAVPGVESAPVFPGWLAVIVAVIATMLRIR